MLLGNFMHLVLSDVARFWSYGFIITEQDYLHPNAASNISASSLSSFSNAGVQMDSSIKNLEDHLAWKPELLYSREKSVYPTTYIAYWALKERLCNLRESILSSPWSIFGG